MLPRPFDWKVSEPKDAKSCRRNRPSALVRQDGRQGSHPGAGGTTQVVRDRRRLSGSRGGLLFPKRELEGGRVDGAGGSFQLLSGEKSGRMWRGGGGYEQQKNDY